MLVNIMVFKLVLIEACFEPLRYNFFLKHHPIVNKKNKFSTSSHLLPCHNNLNNIVKQQEPPIRQPSQLL